MKISTMQTYQYTPITITLETLEDFYDLYNMIDVYLANRKHLNSTEIEKASIFQRDLIAANSK